jgi:membrane carboxypeptidase/penicillin-binding protein
MVTARFLYEKVGFDKVIDIAKAMGIKSPLDPVPSLALGSSGVSVLELTSAYGVWANQGMRAEPLCIKYVLDREGNILEENTPPARRVLDENVAFQMTYLMEGVVQEGTGRRLTRVFGFDKPAAGKTGTTNDETDAWFIGFVPDLVTGVWVGFDDYAKSIGYTGALAALPIWYDFMKSVTDGPVKDFRVPAGVVFKEVDADTGLPATSRSTNVIREVFIKGTEPGS